MPGVPRATTHAAEPHHSGQSDFPGSCGPMGESLSTYAEPRAQDSTMNANSVVLLPRLDAWPGGELRPPLHPEAAGALIDRDAGSSSGGGADGPMRRKEIPVSRLRNVYEFIMRTGRRPTRSSTDTEEKKLGVWLHRFMSNDDDVQGRVRAIMGRADFESMVATIEEAPHVKQACPQTHARTSPLSVRPSFTHSRRPTPGHR